MIIAIDGPAGAGKSTVARGLAKKLGFRFLDTGAMYRAFALVAMENNVSFDCPDDVLKVVKPVELFVDGELTRIGGRDVSHEIRTRAVSEAASQVAAIPQVREILVQQQRQIAATGDFVCEGRDQGSVVFPDAQFKFFVTASIEDRAMRRKKELEQRGYSFTLEEVIAEQIQRDERDANRSVGAMAIAEGAIQISTDTLSIGEVITLMLKIIERDSDRRRIKNNV